MPVGNQLSILGGTGITTSTSGSTVTITATNTSFVWQVVNSGPVNLVKQNGYIPKGSTPIVFILPAAAAIGDSFRIAGYGNLWSIHQNAGQSITIGFVTSTPGVGGSVAASMVSDGIELVTVTANTEFYEIGIQGNLLIS